MTDLSRAQELIGYRFKNVSLLEKAFTHTSYANEHCANGHGASNQRLEFLGDSVLSTAVSTYLYRCYPGMAEGELSRLRSMIVCEETLYEVASFFCFGEFMRFGRGEMLTGGQKKISVLADCVEAVIAAVYLDSDYYTAEQFVLEKLGFSARIEKQAAGFDSSDNKSALQEYFHCPDVNISYEITGRSGPDHDPVFTAQVKVEKDGQLLCSESGSGRSKKAAEQAAAGLALAYFRKNS